MTKKQKRLVILLISAIVVIVVTFILNFVPTHEIPKISIGSFENNLVKSSTKFITKDESAHLFPTPGGFYAENGSNIPNISPDQQLVAYVDDLRPDSGINIKDTFGNTVLLNTPQLNQDEFLKLIIVIPGWSPTSDKLLYYVNDYDCGQEECRDYGQTMNQIRHFYLADLNKNEVYKLDFESLSKKLTEIQNFSLVYLGWISEDTILFRLLKDNDVYVLYEYDTNKSTLKLSSFYGKPGEEYTYHEIRNFKDNEKY